MARMTKEERQERKAERARTEARLQACYEEAKRVVNTGVCPQCGGKLLRNLALNGWWVCEQRGSIGFRKDAEKESCSFQTFTE